VRVRVRGARGWRESDEPGLRMGRRGAGPVLAGEAEYGEVLAGEAEYGEVLAGEAEYGEVLAGHG
jgi:hypothetical protein